ncbi:MAG: carboxypeptidase-like regulatory domain-containing protein [Chitinophagaceae bacterium]
MKLLKVVFTALLTFSLISAFAQVSVSGRIIDSASKEPLPGASVFCQNTTIGTVTNKQGEFSLNLKSGGYELIISYTGYQTRNIRITSNETVKMDIELTKEDKSMSEVVIKSSNEVPDGWQKYGSFFIDNFIGTTSNAAKCVLQNPEVLKFYFLKKSNKLRVLATEPLIIKNKALGYNMTYQLDSFVYQYKTDLSLYRGNCLYAEIDTTEDVKNTWKVARQKAYNGSKLHFMRSYFDSTLKENGFLVDLLSQNDNMKFDQVTNPYDTTYYAYDDSTNEAELDFPRKFSVTYIKAKPEPEYLKKFNLPKNVGTQISYIELLNTIAIKENGYYYDQKDWINQGYWSWKNLADQLPYDYNPGQ